MTSPHRRFEWFYGLEENYVYPTISIVEGTDRKEISRILGGNGIASEEMTVSQAGQKMTRDDDAIGLGEDSGLVFTVEALSSVLAVPGVLRDISRNGRCVSTRFSIEGVSSFHYAVRGELVAYEFDVEDVVLPLQNSDPRWNAAWSESPADFDDDEIAYGVQLLALTERIMGLAPQESWFSNQLETIFIPASFRSENEAYWDIP
ncbi:hypothetical protein [Streptomyces niveus]|uniref:hypothetical protein n=1 Tax=Streptomyces niveus TaxID=193462 RepID=UPI00343C1163